MFAGKLGQPQARTLDVSNTSTATLSYAARLHGHEDFSLESGSIVLAPKSTGQVVVGCKPTTGSTQHAYLVMAPSRDSGAFAATLVFRFVSSVRLRTHAYASRA